VSNERNRIGRDLDDGVIQSMHAVGLTLEDISDLANQKTGVVRPQIEEVDDLTPVIGDIRRYIMSLRPTELHGRRLEEAMASSLVGYLKDRAAVSVTADLELNPSLLPERYFVNIWHIIQESSPILRNTPTPIMFPWP